VNIIHDEIIKYLDNKCTILLICQPSCIYMNYGGGDHYTADQSRTQFQFFQTQSNPIQSMDRSYAWPVRIGVCATFYLPFIS